MSELIHSVKKEYLIEAGRRLSQPDASVSARTWKWEGT